MSRDQVSRRLLERSGLRRFTNRLGAALWRVIIALMAVALLAGHAFAYSVNVSIIGPGTVQSSDGSLSCRSFCIFPEPAGATVTWIAVPSSGYYFAGWSGDCTGSGNCTLSVNASSTIRAEFDLTTGTASVSVTPSAIAFGNQVVGTTSAATTVTVANTGTVALSLSSITATAGFTVAHNCPTSISAGSSCTASVAFAPAITGAVNGSLFVATSAGTKSVSLSGTGLAASSLPVATPAALDFGTQSINTTSLPLQVTLSNAGGVAVTVNSVSATTGFAVTGNCSTLQPGASCSLSVTFTPGSSSELSGSVNVATTQGAFAIPVKGAGERSLVTHYYQAIFRRAPDASGSTYWTGEAARMSALGVDVKEVWFAMALSFFSSAEYLSFGRNNSDYVSDLYNTFYNRAPDAGGLAYWTGQLAQGTPREIVLASFMFSPEFSNFVAGIFGTTTSGPEAGIVVDFYRGLLARLPDTGGFNYWVQQFRTAECQGAGAVYAQVEAISSAFASGGEYAARQRSHAQFIGDLYNAFLRRGGDLAGVQFWIGQLDAGAQTSEQVRRQFVASPEFQARVNALIAHGCAPTIVGVDNANPLPMSVLTLTTSGIDPTRPVTLTFSSGTGFSVTSNALRVKADGTVLAAIPFYIDPVSHSISGGTVQLMMTQGATTSAGVQISIQALPPVSAYGVAPGQITHAYLVFEALLHAQAMNVSQAVTATGVADMHSATDGLSKLLKASVLARNDVDLIREDSTRTFSWGTAPDGTPLVYSARDLDLMDRVLGLYLSQVLAAKSSVTQAKAAKSLSSFLSSLPVIGNLRNSVRNFFAKEDDFVLGEAAMNATGEVLENPWITKIGGGLGMVSAWGSLSRSMDTIGSAILTAADCGATTTPCPETAESVWNDGLEFVKAEVGVITSTTGFFGFSSTLSTVVANSLSSVLTTIQGVNDGTLNLPGIAAPWVSDTTLVQDAVTRLGEVYGTVDISNSLGSSASQTSVEAQLDTSSGGTFAMDSMADQSGNYAVYVPLGLPNVSYRSVWLRMFDLLTGNDLTGTTVDLSNLQPGGSLPAPTTSGSCYDGDRGVDVNDDPDCD